MRSSFKSIINYELISQGILHRLSLRKAIPVSTRSSCNVKKFYACSEIDTRIFFYFSFYTLSIKVFKFSSVQQRDLENMLYCRRTHDVCIRGAYLQSLVLCTAGKLPLEIPAEAVRHLVVGTTG